MSTCIQNSADVIFSRVNTGFCSFDTVPLAGSNLEFVLVLYRITKFVLKTRLDTELLYAFFRAFLQAIRVFAEHFDNRSFFTEAFLLFNDRSINGRMGFFVLNSLFELIEILVSLGQEIEVSLKVGVYYQDSLVVMRDSP